MEWVMLGLLVVGAPLAFFIWLTVKATRADRVAAQAMERVHELQTRLDRLDLARPPLPLEPREPSQTTARTRVPPPVVLPPTVVPIPPVVPRPVIPVAPVPPRVPAAPPLAAPAAAAPAINWEQFMGVKLFAWLGGFALFLGMAFFVKYSFDNNLVSPQVRMAIGFIIGIGLLVGGMLLVERKFPALGQTLCATGTVVLYANIFAASGFYHIFGPYPAFGLMVLVTAVAFLLAVRLDAQVVAVLGLLGGFLTPILISTGKDNPLGLFGYLGLLNAGVIAIVARKRWSYQVLLAALGTAIMELAWADKFFHVEKAPVAMGIFLSMEALFVIGFLFVQAKQESNRWIVAGTFLVAVMPLLFTFYLLTFRSLAQQPLVVFSFVLAADIGLLLLAVWRDQLRWTNLVGGGLAFLALMVWTLNTLDNSLLNWALGLYFVFAVLHSVFPVVMSRLRPGAKWVEWAHVFPALAMLLVIITIVHLPEVSWLIWLCVLAIDLLVFALAIVAGSVLAIIGALLLTLLAAGFWLFSAPAQVTGVPGLLVVIGGFAVLFFGAGLWFSRRAATAQPIGTIALPDLPVVSFDARAQLPALSAALPFFLLVMVVARLPLVDPTPIFGLAMLLAVLLLGVARWTKVDALALVALFCTAALEYAWQQTRFSPDNATTPLAWYLAFVAVFTIFPFLFLREMAGRVLPWAAAALAGPVHFRLVYQLVMQTWPGLPAMGLLPGAFAVPPLAGLAILASGNAEKRLSQLAWFGGAALFFVTLIFPIQFERQWITIGWALEGAALLWLFQRVPHSGLRLVGTALLGVAFARLALNPAVLDYHPRSTAAIFNWYLYAYGLTTVCLFAGARLVAGWWKATQWLVTFGTILAFLLLNIEIADYFTAAGSRTLTFQFSGDFARDMTYSIAWALFALALLVTGIRRKVPAARYASLALLGVTLLKLFFHDLAQLNQLYRIGAFVGVAVILLAASFLYQRFVTAEEKFKS